MRFDHQFIAIRERPTLEIFDLALHVMVAHFWPLVTLLVLGTLPWVALDYWLVGWMLDDTYGIDIQAAYYWAMPALVISQAPWGTALMTQYLGKAMFADRPSLGEVIREAATTSPYFFISHGVLRLSVVAIFICLMCDGGSEMTLVAIYLWLTLCVGAGLMVRAFRPYVSEILMLERTPIWPKDKKSIKFSARSKSLHAFASGDLFSKFMVSTFVGVALTFVVLSLFAMVDSALNLRATSDVALTPYYLIAALWLVAGYLAVVRFLCYLDLRIRQEGWAVELRMRAEGQRLAQRLE